MEIAIIITLAIILTAALTTGTTIGWKKKENSKFRTDRIECFMEAYEIQKKAYKQGQEVLRLLTEKKDKKGLEFIKNKIGEDRYEAYFPL